MQEVFFFRAPYVCQVYGETRFSRPLIKIELCYLWMLSSLFLYIIEIRKWGGADFWFTIDISEFDCISYTYIYIGLSFIIHLYIVYTTKSQGTQFHNLLFNFYRNKRGEGGSYRGCQAIYGNLPIFYTKGLYLLDF